MSTRNTAKPKPFTAEHRRRIKAACVCLVATPKDERCHGNMVRCNPSANVVVEIAYERGVYRRPDAGRTNPMNESSEANGGEEKTASGYAPGEWSTKPTARAECHTCGWDCNAANAQAAGAIHARKYKHCVRVQVDVARIYNHEGS